MGEMNKSDFHESFEILRSAEICSENEDERTIDILKGLKLISKNGKYDLLDSTMSSL